MNYDDALEQGLVPWKKQVLKTKWFYVFRDGFPVTEGHMLFVPVENNHECIMKCYAAAHRYGTRKVRMGDCDGFNIGQNVNESAGQTVMYPHVHLIPRRTGDVENPRGGVRHVIPNRGYYYA